MENITKTIKESYREICIEEANIYLKGDQRLDRVYDLWEKYPSMREDHYFWTQLNLYPAEFKKVKAWVFHQITQAVDTPLDNKLLGKPDKQRPYIHVSQKEEDQYWEEETYSSWD